jgi:hypothetical protein
MPGCRVHPPKGANFDSRFVSREGAKNVKEKACDGFSVPSLEKVSSATEFRPLCVRDIFAPFGEWGVRKAQLISAKHAIARPLWGRAMACFAGFINSVLSTPWRMHPLAALW